MALNDIEVDNDIELEYNNIKNIIKRAATEALGEERTARKYGQPIWLTEEVKAVIEGKKNLYQRWLSNHQMSTGANIRLKTRSKKDH